MTMNPMTAADLRAFREQVGMRQADIAVSLGMSLRGYQDIEAGKSAVSDRFVMACGETRWTSWRSYGDGRWLIISDLASDEANGV